MIHWRAGVVAATGRAWSGAVELTVVVEGQEMPALALTELVGSPEVGDRVLLNTSALRRGLGTGGHALVVALPDRLPGDPSGPGHIVKARYTPLQTMVCSVEEQESTHHEAMSEGGPGDAGLTALPVVVAELHSSLPAVLAGIRAGRPEARVGYLMTDSGALPMAQSRTVAGLLEAGWLATTVTTGQAFGGEHEAITVHSGLLAARHVLGCDLVVATQGPGNAGSGTAWGHSGLSSGEVLNAVHTLGGHGLAALRVSAADPRERHRGLSHHAATTLGRVVLGRAELVVPDLSTHPVLAPFGRGLEEEVDRLVDRAAGELTATRVPLDGLPEALAEVPVPMTTMGRGIEDDPAAFYAGAAAGRRAASLLG